MGKHNSSFGLWLVGIVVIMVVIIVMVKITAESTSEYNAAVAEVGQEEWIKGNPDAPVTIIEYSDFECTACASYQRIFAQVFRDFGDDVRLVYRYFPLRGIHPHAFVAAQAAEAAGRQGKFWEMHDQLYFNQTTWAAAENPKDFFAQYAEILELDIDQFLADFDNEDIVARIEDDEGQAQDQGFRGTPTVFVNGKQVSGIETYDDLKTIIEDAGGVAAPAAEPAFQVKSATSS